MPENASLRGSIDGIDVEFVEREATPQLRMELGIQLHLAGSSLSNTASVRDLFGVERAISTVHKADWTNDGNTGFQSQDRPADGLGLNLVDRPVGRRPHTEI
jgi:hypothetical protein